MKILELEKFQGNIALLYLDGFGKVSQIILGSQLKSAAKMWGGADIETFPWASITYEMVVSLTLKMSQLKLVTATIELRLAAIRGVLKLAVSIRQFDAFEFERIRTVKPPLGGPLKPKRLLGSEEFGELIENCYDGSASSSRDATILILMYFAGLKRQQVVDLDYPRNLSADCSVIRLRDQQNREKETPLPQATVETIREWIDFRGSHKGPLFYSILKSGKIGKKNRMTPQAIYSIMKRRVLKSGVKQCSPQDLRRTFGADLMKDNDVITVQELMNLDDPSSTVKYCQRTDKSKIEAIKSLKTIKTKKFSDKT